MGLELASVRASVHPHFQTWISPRPVGRLQPNFIWSIYCWLGWKVDFNTYVIHALGLHDHYQDPWTRLKNRKQFLLICVWKDKISEVLFLHTRPEFPWTRPGLGNDVLHEGCKTTLIHGVRMAVWRQFYVLMSFSAKRFDINVLDGNRTKLLMIAKCSYLSVNLIK